MSNDSPGFDGISPTPSQDDLQETAKRKVLDHFERRIKKAGDFCKARWDRAESNQQFTRGGEHQWDSRDYAIRKDSQRPTFSMPDVGLAVNALAGREATNRTEATFLSRQGEHPGTAEALREWKRLVDERCRAQYVDSDAFRDLTIDAYSWTQRRQVFDGRPKGRMEKKHFPIWEMIWDPTSRETNLEDREWDAWGGYMSIDDFVMQYPKFAGKLPDLLAGGAKAGWVDPTESSTTNRWPWLYRVEGKYISNLHKEIFAVDYEWKEREPCYHTLVPPGCPPSSVTAQELEGMLQAQQQYQRDLATFQQQQVQPPAPPMPGAPPPDPPQPPQEPPPIPDPEFPPDGMDEAEWGEYEKAYQAYVAQYAEVVQQLDLPPFPSAMGPDDGSYRWKYSRALIIGKEIVKQEVLPYRRFSRICRTGFPYPQPGGTVFYTLVDLMRDTQVFKNYIYSMGVSLLQRTAKNTIIYDHDFFDDPADAERRFSHPSAMIRAAAGKDVRTGINELTANLYPNGLKDWIDTADQAAWRPTGLNPQTLGDLPDARRVSGTTLNKLDGAVTIVLAKLFDSHEIAQKADGDLFLALTRVYNDPSDLISVLGEDKKQYVPDKSKWATVMDRDVIVTRAPISAQERENQWDLLSRQGTIDKMVDSGLMPLEILLKMWPETWLSEVDKQQWLQLNQQKQQAAQQAQTPQPRPPAEVINYSLGKSGQPQVDAALAQQIGSAVGALPGK